MPKISVIVPIYNVEKYLEKCVLSLLHQTERDLEIILVDDGSPDKCPEICDYFAKLDDRITVIHKKNGGLSDARNTGLDIATGQYLSFIDSDDFVAENMYECLLASLETNNADMAICNLLKVDETGNVLDINQLLPIQDGCFTPDELIHCFTHQKAWQYIPAWNKLYKHELFQAIRFPVGKVHEDEFLFHRIIHKCNSVVGVAKPLYFYSVRPSSITSTGFSAKRLDLGDALLDQYFFAKENGYCDLRHFSAQRLAQRLEEWLPLVEKDKNSLRKYHELRKKSVFLIFEKNILENAGVKRKAFFYMELIVPGLGRAIKKIIAK